MTFNYVDGSTDAAGMLDIPHDCDGTPSPITGGDEHDRQQGAIPNQPADELLQQLVGGHVREPDAQQAGIEPDDLLRARRRVGGTAGVRAVTIN